MYGEGRNLRYIVGIGLVIVLLFVVIALIMRSGGDSKVPETKRELISYVDDSNVTVTETIIGPITAAESHNEAQISITNQTATLDVSQGFDGNVVASSTYPVTTNAFGEFLSALSRAGFTEGNTDEGLKDDRGYCPTGQRYIFEIHDGSQTIQRFWATSCGGVKTYKGNLPLTLALFEAQIPSFGDLTDNTSL
ncbi:MAG: exported protein of unknown function [Candidatus Saccharibacteria bacterium]|nr:exported protein of unknown function [Candidatus Saccharibacteria bacterium]